jgi:hypothetical protein
VLMKKKYTQRSVFFEKGKCLASLRLGPVK